MERKERGRRKRGKKREGTHGSGDEVRNVILVEQTG